MAFDNERHYEHICLLVRDEFDSLKYGTDPEYKSSVAIIDIFITHIKELIKSHNNATITKNEIKYLANKLKTSLNELMLSKDMIPILFDKKISFIDYLYDPKLLGIYGKNNKDFLLIILNVATAKLNDILQDDEITKKEFLSFMLHINQIVSQNDNLTELLNSLNKIFHDNKNLNEKLLIKTYPAILQAIKFLDGYKSIKLLSEWLIAINDSISTPKLKISRIINSIEFNKKTYSNKKLLEKKSEIENDTAKSLSTLQHEFLVIYYNTIVVHNSDLDFPFSILVECFDYDCYAYHYLIDTILSSELIQNNLLNNNIYLGEFSDIIDNGLMDNLEISGELKLLNKLAQNNIEHLNENILGEMLLFFISNSRYSIVNLILKTFDNINLDIQDDNNDTALHIAVESNNKELIINLIDRGANITIQDIYKDTPLHNFIKTCGDDIEITNLLVIKDIVMIQNCNNLNPLELSIKRKHPLQANILLDYFDITKLVDKKQYYIDLARQYKIPSVIYKIESMTILPQIPACAVISDSRISTNNNYFSILSDMDEEEPSINCPNSPPRPN